MNGVRRFLGGGIGGGGSSAGQSTPPVQENPLPPLPNSASASTSTSTIQDLSVDLSPSSSFSSRSSGQGSNQFFGGIDVGGGGKGRPSWPPSSLGSPPRTPPLNPSRTSGYQQQQQQQQHEVYSPEQSPKTTAALFFRKDKQRPMRIPTDEEVPPLPTSAINGNGNGNGNGIAIGGGGGGSFNGNGKMMMVNSNGISSASPRSSNGGFSPSRSQTSPMSPPHPHHSPHHHHQHNVSSSSPTRIPPLPPHRVSQLSRKSVEKGLSEWKRSSSGMMDTRDELIMSLLASEAIVDSRGYEVLTAEEVEDLKKEHQILSTRLTATSKKLQLETKIRDAAASLSKANASYKSVSKQTAEQLESANRKVELTQKEFWKVAERVSEVQRKLLEHRSSVLSYSVRTLEKKLLPGNGNDVSGNGMGNGNGMSSGYSTPNRSSSQMTPTSPSSTASGLTASSSRGRFDGAHFFAGHSDAVVPQLPRAPPTLVEVLELEEKLRGMGLTLEEERTRRGEVMRELEEERRGREELERELRVELHDADEMVGTLEREVSKLEDYEAQVKYLEGEREVLLKERAELEEKRREVDTLERRMKVLEEQNAEGAATGDLLAKEHESHRLELEQKERELEEVKSMWESDKVAWELERTTLEGEITQSAASARREAEEEGKEKLNEVFEALKSLMQSHGILLVARENTLPAMISSVGTHVEGLNTRLGAFTQAQDEWIALRAKLEADVRGGLDKRESLMGELEQTKKERDEANDMSKLLDEQLKEQARVVYSASPAALTPVEYSGDAATIVATLQPLWAILPSPEARASRMGSRFTPLSPTNSPAPSRSGTSLSEMDVRNLKVLYDPRTSPLSPQSNGGVFSVEAFVERVRSLISDDRALIERLIRFAQAHDLLKKNAERAQKLALESNVALETYQKQVKLLEDRNISMISKQAAFQEEIQHLQDTLDRITLEKLEVETHAAEQAETCAQLTDANNTLSARALTLADEAASAQDNVRNRMEVQLAELNAALAKAKAEIESMRQSQQSQQMALMEELNVVQTENDNLRAQLRAKK